MLPPTEINSTTKTYSTDCGACFDSLAIRQNTVFPCGHGLHTDCYREGSIANVSFKKRCWICKKDIPASYHPQLTRMERCRTAWNEGFASAPLRLGLCSFLTSISAGCLLLNGKGYCGGTLSFILYVVVQKATDPITLKDVALAAATAAAACCLSYQSPTSAVTSFVVTPISLVGGYYLGTVRPFRQASGAISATAAFVGSFFR